MSEPAGIVQPFAGSIAPQGYLLCDGSAVSRTDYADLFTTIGTIYGAGDGTTTFNVPDLSGRVVLGISQGHALGSFGGEISHVLTEQELPTHSHVVPSHSHSNDIEATTPVLSHSITTQPAFNYNRPNSYTTGGSGGGNVINGTTTATASIATNAAIAAHAATDCVMSGSVTNCDAFASGNFGSGLGHSNLQPYLALSYIISTGL